MVRVVSFIHSKPTRVVSAVSYVCLLDYRQCIFMPNPSCTRHGWDVTQRGLFCVLLLVVGAVALTDW
jgi:hypothetical protein